MEKKLKINSNMRRSYERYRRVTDSPKLQKKTQICDRASVKHSFHFRAHEVLVKKWNFAICCWTLCWVSSMGIKPPLKKSSSNVPKEATQKNFGCRFLFFVWGSRHQTHQISLSLCRNHTPNIREPLGNRCQKPWRIVPLSMCSASRRWRSFVQSVRPSRRTLPEFFHDVRFQFGQLSESA